MRVAKAAKATVAQSVDASAIKAYCCTARIALGSEIVSKLWVYNLSGTALACFGVPFLTQLSDSASTGCVVADIFQSLFGGFCVYGWYFNLCLGGFAFICMVLPFLTQYRNLTQLVRVLLH